MTEKPNCKHNNEDSLPKFFTDPRYRTALRVGAVILGMLMSSFVIFQLLFLARVLPHGGIW